MYISPLALRKKKCKRNLLFDDDSSELSSSVSEASSSLKKDNKDYVLFLPNAVKKVEEDVSQCLPDPFPLPKNYRPDVEECLKLGKMTAASKACFFSTIASAVFHYKKFPTRDEKVSIAKQIVKKYPFLGTPGLGTTYVSSVR